MPVTNVSNLKVATITGAIAFEDHDGDVAELEGTIDIDGPKSLPKRSALPSAADITEGVLPISFLLVPLEERPIRIRVVLIDKGGRRSNKVVQTIEVTGSAP